MAKLKPNELTVYGRPAAAGLAAALLAEDVTFKVEPQPMNEYLFWVQPGGSSEQHLQAHRPSGLSWWVLLDSADPMDFGETEHSVTAMDDGHAVLKAVCQRYLARRERDGEDAPHLIDDEIPFTYHATPTVGGVERDDQVRTGSHDTDNPW